MNKPELLDEKVSESRNASDIAYDSTKLNNSDGVKPSKNHPSISSMPLNQVIKRLSLKSLLEGNIENGARYLKAALVLDRNIFNNIEHIIVGSDDLNAISEINEILPNYACISNQLIDESQKKLWALHYKTKAILLLKENKIFSALRLIDESIKYDPNILDQSDKIHFPSQIGIILIEEKSAKDNLVFEVIERSGIYYTCIESINARKYYILSENKMQLLNHFEQYQLPTLAYDLPNETLEQVSDRIGCQYFKKWLLPLESPSFIEIQNAHSKLINSLDFLKIIIENSINNSGAIVKVLSEQQVSGNGENFLSEVIDIVCDENNSKKMIILIGHEPGVIVSQRIVMSLVYNRKLYYINPAGNFRFEKTDELLSSLVENQIIDEIIVSEMVLQRESTDVLGVSTAIVLTLAGELMSLVDSEVFNELEGSINETIQVESKLKYRTMSVLFLFSIESELTVLVNSSENSYPSLIANLSHIPSEILRNAATERAIPYLEKGQIQFNQQISLETLSDAQSIMFISLESLILGDIDNGIRYAKLALAFDNQTFNSIRKVAINCIDLARIDLIKKLLPQTIITSNKQIQDELSLQFATIFESISTNIDVKKVSIARESKENQNIENDTALINASIQGHLQKVKALLEKGADTNFVNNNVTALIHAVSEGHVDVVKTLVSKGAAVNFLPKDGFTALMVAAKFSTIEMVKCLVELGADVNKVSTHGTTVLMCASENPKIEVIKYLVSIGAIGVNDAKENLQRALIFAAKYSNVEMIKYLIELGANLNILNKQGQTALIISSEKGHLGVVKELLENGADTNFVNNNVTALIKAAEKGHVEIVKLLVEKGASVDSLPEDSLTALMYAAKTSNVEMVRCLVKLGANVNKINHYSTTVLMCASENPNIDVIKYLVLVGAVGVNNTQKSGETALMRASQYSHIEMIKYLIELGANVNIINKQGQTALIISSRKGHLGVVKELLENGADTTVADVLKFTALIHAASEGHVDVVKTLVSKGAAVNFLPKDGFTALMVAAKFSTIEMVKCLVELGADVNKVSTHGTTVLMCASENPKIEVIKYLVSIGAIGVNDAKENLQQALIFAAKYSNIEMIKYLIELGANVNIINKQGQTALIMAAENGNLEMCDFLLTAEARVDATNTIGHTPLMKASINGHTIVLKKLLAHGANPNLQSNIGITPLFYAAGQGHVEIVKELVRSGVSVQLNEDNKNALMYAVKFSTVEMVNCLVELQADVHWISSDGWTALMLAAKYNKIDIVKLLLLKSAKIDRNQRESLSREALLLIDEQEKLISNNVLIEKVLSNENNPKHIVELFSMEETIKFNDDTHWNMLMTAAEYPCAPILKCLEEEGADVYEARLDGRAALIIALCKRNTDIIKELLCGDAIISVVNGFGWRGLMISPNDSQTKVIKKTTAKLPHTQLMIQKPFIKSLRNAIENPNVEVIKFLIRNGPNINRIISKNKTTTLMNAASLGHLKVVRMLINTGVTINDVDNDIRTALMYAVESNRVDVVRLLLMNGALNYSRKDGFTPIMVASKMGFIDVVRVLLEFNANIHSENNIGLTSLMIALSEGHLEIVRELMNRGGVVNFANMNTWNALMNSAKYPHMAVHECLVGNGVDINHARLDGRAALIIALCQYDVELISQLRGSEAIVDFVANEGWTALLIPSSKYQEEKMPLSLINSELSQNLVHDTFRSAEKVLANPDVEILKFFITYGLDVNKTGNNDETPLMTTSKEGQLFLVKTLLKCGANISTCDKSGYTALMHACVANQVEVTACLLGHGADVNTKNKDAQTALMTASENGHHDVVRMLLDSGAETDAVDTKKFTALIHAAIKGHVEVVRALVSKGISVNFLPEDGFTALMHACETNQVDVANYLLENGANMNLCNQKGWTALMLSASKGCENSVRLLLTNKAELSKDQQMKLDESALRFLDGVRELLISEERDKASVKPLLNRPPLNSKKIDQKESSNDVNIKKGCVIC